VSDRAPHAIAQAYLRRRYAILFYSLLLTLGAGPLLASVGLELGLMQLLFAANLLAAVAPFQSGPARRTLLFVVILAGGLRLVAGWLDSPAWELAAEGVWVLVALQAVAMALRFSLRAEAVDTEHIYAALGAYLLFGIFFGVLFWLVERLDPAALIVAGADPGDDLSVATGIYFSFVTLATLGYGDIVPKSDVARGLAIVEAVAGQLYLAAMVARLVSLYGPRAGRT